MYGEHRDVSLKCDETDGGRDGDGQVENVGEKRNACRDLVRKPEGNIPPSIWGLDGKIILKCILKRHVETTWSGLVRFRTGFLVSTVMNFGDV